MATDEEIAHLRHLIAVHSDLRRVLELQIAQYGEGRAPAEKVLELKAEVEAVARLNAEIVSLSVPADVQQATGPEPGITVLRQQVKHLGDQINTAMRWMTAEITAIRAESTAYRSTNDANRRTLQRLNMAILITIAAMVAYQVFLK